MAINISLLLVPWPIFLTALILIVAAIIILTLIERVVHKRAVLKNEAEETYYFKRLQEAKSLQNEPAKFLSSLDDLAREFFEEEYQITGVRYSELIEKLKKENDGNSIKFCEVMQDALYSGEEVSKEKLTFLFDKLSFIVRKNEESKLEKYMKKKRAEQTQIIQQPTSEAIKASVSSPVLSETKPEIQKTSVQTAQPVQAKPVTENVLVKEEVNMNIAKYLSEGTKRGFQIEQLKQKLLENGFPERAVDLAIGHVSKSVKETIQQKAVEVKEREVKSEPRQEEVIPKAREIAVVPYISQKIEVKKKEYPRKEPKSYESINNMDDLDRIREKIKDKKTSLSVEGYGGAGLGSV